MLKVNGRIMENCGKAREGWSDGQKETKVKEKSKGGQSGLKCKERREICFYLQERIRRRRVV